MNGLQFGATAMYQLNETIGVGGELVYQNTKNNVKNYFGQSASYQTNIIDAGVKATYKFSFNQGYVKPYVGIGIMNYNESQLKNKTDHTTLINSYSSGTLHASLGLYGAYPINEAVNITGTLDISNYFGDVFADRRDVLGTMIPTLNYETFDVNAGIGIDYTINKNKMKLKLDAGISGVKGMFEYSYQF